MKKKFLALTMASAIMLMGAGYAYWTDSVTMKNVVTTGEFDVNFVANSAKLFSVNENSGKYVGNVDKVNLGNQNLAIQTGNDELTFNISNVYPGVGARYELKIKNDGTIPAVFNGSDVTFDASNTSGLDAVMEAKYDVKLYGTNGVVKRDLGFHTVKLNALEGSLNTILNGVRLEPGEFIAVGAPVPASPEVGEVVSFEGMEITLPSTVGTPQNPDEFENSTMKFDIQLNWKQHNA